MRSVPGGFENLTRHTVPRDVSALLSYGPKFMVPTFTQMCSGERVAEYNNLVKNLRNYGFHSAGYEGKESSLSKAYAVHSGSNVKLSLIERSMLSMAHQTTLFLQSLRESAIIVNGDKGKKVGLVYRSDYSRLCKVFLDGALSSGMYVEINVEDEGAFLQQVVEQYNRDADIVIMRNRSIKGSCLYVPGLRSINEERLDGLNKQVSYILSKIKWRFPSFSPTLKFHKSPLVLRPVISKFDGPSISLGLVIKAALEAVS